MEEYNIRNEIRTMLHTMDIQGILNLIPSLTNEQACNYIKNYHDNYEAMRKRIMNNEAIDKELAKENQFLFILESYYVRDINSKGKGL